MSIRRAFLLAIGLALPVTANAQMMPDVSCDDSARLKHTLSKVMGAERHGMGLRDPDTFLEIWIDRNGDWMIVQSYTNGTSCIVAMGADWEDIVPAPA